MQQIKNEVVRSADRVHYLKDPAAIGTGLKLDNLTLQVYRWTAKDHRTASPIRLSLEASPFDVSQALTAEQARAIAGALLAAAQEAEFAAASEVLA